LLILYAKRYDVRISLIPDFNILFFQNCG